MSSKKPFYITTTLPYVNAEPHIGHALEFIRADIIARSKRLAGFDVFFNTGDYTRKNNIVETFNYSELLPVVMLNNGVPLLKVKSFMHMYRRKLFNIIKKTDYPTGLIADHLKTMHIVNTMTRKAYLRRGLAKRAKPLTRTIAYKRITRINPKG